MMSSQDDHWLTPSPQDFPIDMKTRHSLYHGVGVFTGDRNVVPPLIFLHGLRFNTKVYINGLEEVVLAWIKRVADLRHYVCQRDSAVAHKQENPVLTEKMSAPKSLLTSSHLTPQSAISLIMSRA